MRTVSVIALIIAFFFVGWQSKAMISNSLKNGTEIKLNKMIDKYGDNVYRSYYGIEELRPFSILQFQKTIDIYANEWKSSGEYLDQLNDKDLDLLNNKIAGFIESNEDINKDDMINKINSWCVTQKQIDLIVQDYEINEDQLFKAIFDSELTNSAFDEIRQNTNWSIDKLSSSEREKILQNAFNKISALELSEQLIYYSKIYERLSRMAVK